MTNWMSISLSKNCGPWS